MIILFFTQTIKSWPIAGFHTHTHRTTPSYYIIVVYRVILIKQWRDMDWGCFKNMPNHKAATTQLTQAKYRVQTLC